MGVESTRSRHRIWVLGVVIIALAFAAGFGARALLGGEDSEGDAITAAQASSVQVGISGEELDKRLGGAEPATRQPVAKGGVCLGYRSAEMNDRLLVFCFREDHLFEKHEVELE
jgi:hypothetical protein